MKSLVIPENLYGREKEIATLIESLGNSGTVYK